MAEKKEDVTETTGVSDGEKVIPIEGPMYPGGNYQHVVDGSGERMRHMPNRVRQEGERERVLISPDVLQDAIEMQRNVRRHSKRQVQPDLYTTIDAMIRVAANSPEGILLVQIELARMNLLNTGLDDDQVNVLMSDVEKNLRSEFNLNGNSAD